MQWSIDDFILDAIYVRQDCIILFYLYRKEIRRSYPIVETSGHTFDIVVPDRGTIISPEFYHDRPICYQAAIGIVNRIASQNFNLS